MSDDINELNLEIETREIEGGGIVRVLKDPDGNDLFGLSESFTDEQIKEVYSLADQFFKRGIQIGVMRLQSDFRSMLGLAVSSEESE